MFINFPFSVSLKMSSWKRLLFAGFSLVWHKSCGIDSYVQSGQETVKVVEEVQLIPPLASQTISPFVSKSDDPMTLESVVAHRDFTRNDSQVDDSLTTREMKELTCFQSVHHAYIGHLKEGNSFFLFFLPDTHGNVTIPAPFWAASPVMPRASLNSDYFLIEVDSTEKPNVSVQRGFGLLNSEEMVRVPLSVEYMWWTVLDNAGYFGETRNQFDLCVKGKNDVYAIGILPATLNNNSEHQREKWDRPWRNYNHRGHLRVYDATSTGSDHQIKKKGIADNTKTSADFNRKNEVMYYTVGYTTMRYTSRTVSPVCVDLDLYVCGSKGYDRDAEINWLLEHSVDSTEDLNEKIQQTVPQCEEIRKKKGIGVNENRLYEAWNNAVFNDEEEGCTLITLSGK